jgi:hypothetical protein
MVGTRRSTLVAMIIVKNHARSKSLISRFRCRNNRRILRISRNVNSKNKRNFSRTNRKAKRSPMKTLKTGKFR